MTKKEKLRIYNDCLHEIGLLKKGQEVDFCCYQKPWDSKPLNIGMEYDYYRVNDGTEILYIVFNFKEIVAMACRHVLKNV